MKYFTTSLLKISVRPFINSYKLPSRSFKTLQNRREKTKRVKGAKSRPPPPPSQLHNFSSSSFIYYLVVDEGGGPTVEVIGIGSPRAMNAEVLQSLTRLADTLAKLDERHYYTGNIDGDDGNGTDEITAAAAAMSLSSQPSTSSSRKSDTNDQASTIGYWRTLPTEVTAAYQLLSDGAEYIHATSTKYALVGKIDSAEGGKLAVELRKGAQLMGTGTLLLFSPECGSSRSLRHFVKQSSRAVISSLLSLIRAYEDGSAQGTPNDGNNIGAQKTGAVWSACDNLRLKLPKGNRAAMTRELLIWVRDCNESIEEFDEMLALGPRDEDDEDGDEEEQYSQSEMKIARAAVNIMKCSKNVLGLVMKVCECVGGGVWASPNLMMKTWTMGRLIHCSNLSPTYTEWHVG